MSKEYCRNPFKGAALLSAAARALVDESAQLIGVLPCSHSATAAHCASLSPITRPCWALLLPMFPIGGWTNSFLMDTWEAVYVTSWRFFSLSRTASARSPPSVFFGESTWDAEQALDRATQHVGDRSSGYRAEYVDAAEGEQRPCAK